MENQAHCLTVQLAQSLQLYHWRVLGQTQMQRIFMAGLALATQQQHGFHANALCRQRLAVGTVGLHRVDQRALQHLSTLALTAQYAAFTHQFIDRAANGVAIDAEALGQLKLGRQVVAGLVAGQLVAQGFGQPEV
ncbi:hypothetical protein ALP75_201253 [Pseudomonas syringae pv. actinidiae]|nr:hypothetical protein ALP75_201253 [Pseudomonas syringae pv. actinidiae]